MNETLKEVIDGPVYLRLSDLLKVQKFIEEKGIDPSKVIVAYQRIEDVYFKEHGWKAWNFDFVATDEDVAYANEKAKEWGGPVGGWNKDNLNAWCQAENGDYILAWGYSMHKDGDNWVLKICAHY